MFLGPEDYYRPSNPDIGVYILLVGLLFHALSNVLDHLEEINESLKKNERGFTMEELALLLMI